MNGFTFLKEIYEWLWLFRRHFWVGVTVYSTFMGGCDCLEHFYGWVWMGGCDWVWLSVGGCDWVWAGKTVKPKEYMDEKLKQYMYKDPCCVEVIVDSFKFKRMQEINTEEPYLPPQENQNLNSRETPFK